MNFVWKERARKYWPQILGVVGIISLGTVTTLAIFAASPNVTVDFNKTVTTADPYAFSGTISTYGNQGTIVNSPKQRTNLSNLGLGLYRIPLQWNNGKPVSSAEGAAGGPSADTWVANIKAIGAQPMVVLGGSQDNNFTPQDAANMVRHFSGTNKVTYWVIGNEPDNRGISMDQYCSIFNSTVDAMKAVDPTIKVAGPALTDYEDYKYADYDKFLACAGSRVDIVDFHDYGERTQNLSDNITKQAERYEAKIKDLRARIQRIVPNRASQITIQVGEWNLTPIANGDLDERMYSGGTTVYGALAAGNIAKAGARGHQYSDQNNPLGLTFESQTVAGNFGKTIADPMPLYHGIGMFTGEKLFRGFGKQFVETTSQSANISAYASTNQKNIVLANKNQTQAELATVELKGFNGGTAEIWQTDKNKPFDAPAKKATVNVKDLVEYELPAWTVTTIVLIEGSTPAPAPTPTPTPTPPAPAPAPSPSPTTSGLLAEYFGNKTLSGSSKTRTDSTINFNWGSAAPLADIPANQFSARWTGKIAVPATAAYTFYLTGDDGVRMWVDGKQVINGWKDQSSVEHRGTITLEAGKRYDIKVEYYENYGDAVVKLAWSAPNLAQQIVPASAFNTTTSGLKASYYTYKGNGTLGDLIATNISQTIDYDLGSKQPQSNVPKDRFAAVWTGTLTASTTGSYELSTESDDGVRVKLDDKTVIDNWTDHSRTTNKTTVSLTAGKPVKLYVAYYENYGDSVMRLLWKAPGQSKPIVVPSSSLSY